nr:heterogeneous nuclear ribonucleoprotein A1, A2/B1 homolog [Ipomoea batatas]
MSRTNHSQSRGSRHQEGIPGPRMPRKNGAHSPNREPHTPNGNNHSVAAEGRRGGGWGKVEGDGGGGEGVEEVGGRVPESGGGPVVDGGGDEARLVGGNVVAEEMKRRRWDEEAVDLRGCA